jgi:hypothetical protein
MQSLSQWFRMVEASEAVARGNSWPIWENVALPRWARAYGFDPETAWEACSRAEWLVWWAATAGVPPEIVVPALAMLLADAAPTMCASNVATRRRARIADAARGYARALLRVCAAAPDPTERPSLLDAAAAALRRVRLDASRELLADAARATGDAPPVARRRDAILPPPHADWLDALRFYLVGPRRGTHHVALQTFVTWCGRRGYQGDWYRRRGGPLRQTPRRAVAASVRAALVWGRDGGAGDGTAAWVAADRARLDGARVAATPGDASRPVLIEPAGRSLDDQTTALVQAAGFVLVPGDDGAVVWTPPVGGWLLDALAGAR